MNKLIFVLVLLSLLAPGCITTRSENEVYSEALIERQEQMPYEDDLTQGLEM